jgi:hypothetical protein
MLRSLALCALAVRMKVVYARSSSAAEAHRIFATARQVSCRASARLAEAARRRLETAPPSARVSDLAVVKSLDEGLTELALETLAPSGAVSLLTPLASLPFGREPPTPVRNTVLRDASVCGAACPRRKPCGAGRREREKRARRRVTPGWDGGDTRSAPPQPSTVIRRIAGAAIFRPAEPCFRSQHAAAACMSRWAPSTVGLSSRNRHPTRAQTASKSVSANRARSSIH